MVGSIALFALFGLRLGLDFTGGSLYEVSFSTERPQTATLNEALLANGINNAKIQPASDNGYLIRMPEISEETHQSLKTAFEEKAHALNPDNTLTEVRFESFGASLGAELARKSWYAIIAVLVCIIIYLAFAFRHVSQPVASWKFGTVAIIALIHDTLCVIGLFSLLGYFAGVEIDSFFITALLTLLGFSVHDTIVTLDRIRENLFHQKHLDFETIVNNSINQTIARSINTSVTTMLALIAIYLFGGPEVRNFSIALIAGIFIGVYSSIFIAAPLLVTWQKLSEKKA